NNITILARGKTYESLQERGVRLKHFLQKKNSIDHFNYISELSETDQYDIIFVTMKYSDFYSVVPVLAKNITQNIIFVGITLIHRNFVKQFLNNQIQTKIFLLAF